MFPASPGSRQSCGLIIGTFWGWEYLPLPLRGLSSPRKASQASNTSGTTAASAKCHLSGKCKGSRSHRLSSFLPAPPLLLPGIIVLISPLILERQTPFCIRQVSLLSFVGDNHWIGIPPPKTAHFSSSLASSPPYLLVDKITQVVSRTQGRDKFLGGQEDRRYLNGLCALHHAW